MRIALVGAAALVLAASALHADPDSSGKAHGQGTPAASQDHGKANAGGSRIPDKGPRGKPPGDSDSGPTQANAAKDRRAVDIRATGPPGRVRTGESRGPAIGAGVKGNATPRRDSTAPERASEIQARKITNRVITHPRDFHWASLVAPEQAIEGCPPGLAQKRNGCLPPGQAKKRAWYRNDWYGSRWHDRYRYYDGYMLRLGIDDHVLSYIPLLGGALSVGNVWPSAYDPIALPAYYVDYFDLGPADGYRYFGNTIYRVDPDTAAIRSVAALLTGQDFFIGQPIPPGYDVYNVPYPHRDRYRDESEAFYRYSDGYVYQVDPQTQLIMAAIELQS